MNSLNIVVVEDHDDLREATVAALGRMGHKVRGVDCAEAMDDELGAYRADLLVVDLNLPGEDGISLTRRIREADPDIGIIIVSARHQVHDKIIGYSSGADLYLTKPTTLEELGAAIRALSRRLHPPVTTASQLTIDPVTLQLHGPHGTVDISDFECTLLSAFAGAIEHRLAFTQIIEFTGKSADEFSKGAFEVQIVRLRKKLEQVGATTPTIKAIRGTGYQFCVPVSVGKYPVATIPLIHM